MSIVNSGAGRVAKGAVLALSIAAFGAPEAYAGPEGFDGVRAQKLGAYQSGSLEEQGLVEQVRRRGRYRRHRGRRGRGAALGVLGGIVALGTIAAIAESNRRDRYYDRYYEPRRRYYRGGGGCSYWADRCAQNWGYGNSNFYGCLRYHRC